MAQFQAWARPAIAEIRERGATPVLVGGSALYTRAILDRFEFPGTDESLRRELEAELERVGHAALHARLARLDPEAAERMLVDNGRRVVRALEVIALTGRPWSASLPQLEYADPLTLQVGVDIDRPTLDARIDRRVREMYDGGLVEEVERLLDLGLERGRTASRAIGYREAAAYLRGEMGREDAIVRTQAATRRFARRQDGVVPQGPSRRLGGARRPAAARSRGRRHRGTPPRRGSTTGRVRLQGGGTRPLGARLSEAPCASPSLPSPRPPLVAGLLVAAPPAPAEEPSAAPAGAARPTAKIPTAVGYGGAVTTVDPEASAAALKVLKKGGNAADAAVAAAATLGVTEPYSAGIGGGGYFVHYDAKTGKVRTIDGRETAPAKMPNDAFIDPATGKPYPFTPELVTSGVSVGVPGTPATWDRALERFGTLSLAEALKPAIKVANRGFVVDDTFRQQTLDNEAALRGLPGHPQALPARRRRPGGRLGVPQPAARPHLHDARRAAAWTHFYRGKLAELMVKIVRDPRTTAEHHAARPARPPLPQGPQDLRGPSTRSRPGSATAATTSTAWPRRRPAAPPSARRSTSSSATTSPR